MAEGDSDSHGHSASEPSVPGPGPVPGPTTGILRLGVGLGRPTQYLKLPEANPCRANFSSPLRRAVTGLTAQLGVKVAQAAALARIQVCLAWAQAVSLHCP